MVISRKHPLSCMTNPSEKEAHLSPALRLTLRHLTTIAKTHYERWSHSFQRLIVQPPSEIIPWNREIVVSLQLPHVRLDVYLTEIGTFYTNIEVPAYHEAPLEPPLEPKDFREFVSCVSLMVDAQNDMAKFLAKVAPIHLIFPISEFRDK